MAGEYKPVTVNLTKLDAHDWSGLRDQVVDLLGRGLSINYISKAVGRPWKMVAEIARSEMEERFKNRDQIKLSHAMQLSWAKKKLTDAIADKEREGKDFNRKDLELLLKALDQEARLYGLNAAAQVEVRAVDQFSDEELRVELERHGVQMKQLTPHQPPPPESELIEEAEFETAADETTPPQPTASPPL